MNFVTEKTFPSFEQLPPKEHLNWQEGKCGLLYRTPIFDVSSAEKTNSQGMTYPFIKVDAKQWVSVLPVFTGTDGVERFILERQFRHGTGKTSIEFPGGIVEENEDPKDAARRELLEETGLDAGSIELLGDVSPNSAFMTNRTFIFVAKNLVNTGKFDWDAQEEIDVFSMPCEEVFKGMGEGEMDNGMMLITSFFYLKNKGFKL